MAVLALSNVCTWLLSALIMVLLPSETSRAPPLPHDASHSNVSRLSDPTFPRLPPFLSHEICLSAEKRLAALTMRLFTVETDAADGGVDLGECPICLAGPYSQGEVIAELHCHHSFHWHCIARWIDKGGGGCPMRCPPRQTPVGESADFQTISPLGLTADHVLYVDI